MTTRPLARHERPVAWYSLQGGDGTRLELAQLRGDVSVGPGSRSGQGRKEFVEQVLFLEVDELHSHA